MKKTLITIATIIIIIIIAIIFFEKYNILKRNKNIEYTESTIQKNYMNPVIPKRIS